MGTTASLLLSVGISETDSEDVHNESHLLRGGALGALDDLNDEVSCERDDLTGYETSVSSRLGVGRSGAEQCGEVQGGERVENDDFVRCVGVDALVEREGSRVGVEGRVGGGVVFHDRRLGETGDELLQVSKSLRRGDRRSDTVVVVERKVVVVWALSASAMVEECDDSVNITYTQGWQSPLR